MRKKIAIFTGNRAEYGLQYSIIKAIKNHKNLDYKLIISGSHLDKKFGETKKVIKKDKFKISCEIKLKNYSKKELSFTPLNISEIIKKLTIYLKKNRPDIFLINADRFETFAAGITATQMNIPTVHVEGGDITEGGTLDDNVRHALTKLSHLHFVTNKKSFNNLIKMGEEKWRIHNVGLASNDIIKKNNLLHRKTLEKNFKISSSSRILLFTFHAFGTDLKKMNKDICILAKVISFYLNKNYVIIATYPNNDYGSDVIINKLIEIKKLNKDNKNFILKKSLGNFLFYSLLALAKKNKIILVGNSSAGIKECIAFKCPAVNIGERQKSRLKPINVIDTKCNFKNIIFNISKAFDSKVFKKKLLQGKNPYYKNNTGKKIANIINKLCLNKEILNKKHIL